MESLNKATTTFDKPNNNESSNDKTLLWIISGFAYLIYLFLYSRFSLELKGYAQILHLILFIATIKIAYDKFLSNPIVMPLKFKSFIGSIVVFLLLLLPTFLLSLIHTTAEDICAANKADKKLESKCLEMKNNQIHK